MLKNLRQWLLVLLLAALVGTVGWYYFGTSARKTKMSASVLLEQVKEVTKLVAIEGQFSELFNFEESWGYDLAPLRKSAIVRVEATAFVGHDLEGVAMTADETNKVIRIGPLPAPELLALEKDLDYYDFKQGIFNSFTKTDLNLIQQKADQIIRTKIQESGLILRAEQQLHNHLEALNISFHSIGWRLEILPNVNGISPLEPVNEALTPD